MKFRRKKKQKGLNILNFCTYNRSCYANMGVLWKIAVIDDSACRNVIHKADMETITADAYTQHRTVNKDD